MLDLQSASRTSSNASSSEDGHSIIFNRVVGSLGASIGLNHVTTGEFNDDDNGDGTRDAGSLTARLSENVEAGREKGLESVP